MAQLSVACIGKGGTIKHQFGGGCPLKGQAFEKRRGLERSSPKSTGVSPVGAGEGKQPASAERSGGEIGTGWLPTYESFFMFVPVLPPNPTRTSPVRGVISGLKVAVTQIDVW